MFHLRKLKNSNDCATVVCRGTLRICVLPIIQHVSKKKPKNFPVLYLFIRQVIHGTGAVHVACRHETLQHPQVDKVCWQTQTNRFLRCWAKGKIRTADGKGHRKRVIRHRGRSWSEWTWLAERRKNWGMCNLARACLVSLGGLGCMRGESFFLNVSLFWFTPLHYF